MQKRKLLYFLSLFFVFSYGSAWGMGKKKGEPCSFCDKYDKVEMAICNYIGFCWWPTQKKVLLNSLCDLYDNVEMMVCTYLGFYACEMEKKNVSPSSLGDLCDDVGMVICDYLGFMHLLSIRLVNKKFYDIVCCSFKQQGGQPLEIKLSRNFFESNKTFFWNHKKTYGPVDLSPLKKNYNLSKTFLSKIDKFVLIVLCSSLPISNLKL